MQVALSGANHAWGYLFFARTKPAASPATPCDEGDFDDLPDSDTGFAVDPAWRHEVARLDSGRRQPS